MNRHQRLLAFLLLLLPGARVSAQVGAQIRERMAPIYFAPPDTVHARQLAGCYDLEFGGPPASGPTAWIGDVPTRVLLGAAAKEPPLPAGFWFVVRPLTDSVAPADPHAPGWSPVGPDSLQVLAHYDEYTHTVVFLRLLPDSSLRGTVRHFGDVIARDARGRRMWEGEPKTTVTARRISCSPDADAAASLRPSPNGSLEPTGRPTALPRLGSSG